VPSSEAIRPPVLVDLGLVLRPWRFDVADLAFVRQAAADVAIARYSTVGAADSSAAAEVWLKGRVAPDRCDWVMEVDSEPVGRISVATIDTRTRSAEFGYWVLAEHRRRGYARAGVTAATRYAVEQLGMRSLRIEHERANDASCSLATDVGFGSCAPASTPTRVAGTLRHLWVHTRTFDGR
jgi:RimJ/RimL family protein N-acetyltransferase